MKKKVRIWFSKDKQARFISHLDLNRVVLRAVCMASIPVEYTQGFNPHPYVSFALPLSLGMRSVHDCFDVNLIKDIDTQDSIKRLNHCLPNGIEVYSITTPYMQIKEIVYAEFKIKLFHDSISADDLKIYVEDLLGGKSIDVEKKTKSGIKTIDLKPYVKKIKSIYTEENQLVTNLILNAGSNININPSLIIKALNLKHDIDLSYDITRCYLLNKNLKELY